MLVLVHRVSSFPHCFLLFISANWVVSSGVSAHTHRHTFAFPLVEWPSIIIAPAKTALATHIAILCTSLSFSPTLLLFTIIDCPSKLALSIGSNLCLPVSYFLLSQCVLSFSVATASTVVALSSLPKSIRLNSLVRRVRKTRVPKEVAIVDQRRPFLCLLCVQHTHYCYRQETSWPIKFTHKRTNLKSSTNTALLSFSLSLCLLALTEQKRISIIYFWVFY